MNLNLNEAVQIISDTIFLQDSSQDFPYFFIVGAGISMPEIPSASKIIEVCKEKVKERGDDIYSDVNKKSLDCINSPMRSYSFWIESAFPNPINRSKFYKNLILKSKISSANLMLAQILQSNKIASTVFTTNFDDKIKQALDIIGEKEVFVSENPMDNLVVNVNNREIQIVHVHGTYRFYDSANLEKEISNISEQMGTMSAFQVLRNFLQQKAPIIVGYSGWEDDVIMTCIKERISLPVPYNYIWVCYSTNDYASLPNWLRSSDRIYFVISESLENNCEDNSFQMFLQQKGRDKLSKIPATLFFAKLISQLKIEPPLIFCNPYEYYSEMIEKTLPHNEDVLHLRHWAERMKYIAQNDSQIDQKIRELELASISKDFKKASEIIISLGNMEITTPDMTFLGKVLISEFLNDVNVIKDVDTKIELANAVLSFIKSHYDVLLSIKCLNRLLLDVLFIRFKKLEKSSYVKIVNSIYELSLNRDELLDAHLTSIGIASTIAEEKFEKIRFLNEFLIKFPSQATSRNLKYKKCITLIDKCELMDEAEAIELYIQAEELCMQIDLVELNTRLLKCKAVVATKINEATLQLKWATECLNAALSIDTKKCKYEVLKIVEYITRIPPNNLNKIDNVEEQIESLLLNTYKCDCDTENCECTLLTARALFALAQITSTDSKRLEFFQKILSMENKFPHECGQFQETLFITYSQLCGLSTLFIPDDIKIEYLLKMKELSKKSNYQKQTFDLTLSIALKLGNPQKYFESELQADLDRVEFIELIDTAFKAYSSKNFPEAEKLFSSMKDSNVVHIKDTARNNLAFMARRGETSKETYSVPELLDGVADGYMFKHMNMLLYYLRRDVLDYEKCKASYDFLQSASREDIESLTECWGDADFVGEESIIGMIIINSLSCNKQGHDLLKTTTPGLMEMFGLDVLELLIE